MYVQGSVGSQIRQCPSLAWRLRESVADGFQLNWVLQSQWGFAWGTVAGKPLRGENWCAQAQSNERQSKMKE